MSIEIRQLLIKSTVGGDPSPEGDSTLGEEQYARLKAEILDACKTLLNERRRREEER